MSDDKQSEDFILDDIDQVFDPATRGWNGEMGPMVPAGDYTVEIIDAAVKPTKKGDGRNLVLTLAVKDEGEYYDTELMQWLKIPGPGDKKGVAMRMAHVVRDVLGVQQTPGVGLQRDALIGRRMLITVTVAEGTKTEFDPVTNEDVIKKTVQTSIQNERPVEGGQAPTQVAPTAPAGAKAAVAAKRPAAAPPAAARR
jgi:hypothetical protein